jgi:NTP pyrophosphatase (non-canonical NTP hydrolase)
MNQAQIRTAIKKERVRQYRMFGDKSIAGKLPLDTKFRILGEEVGEVARAIDHYQRYRRAKKPVAQKVRDDLRRELVQVAACAVAMLESL